MKNTYLAIIACLFFTSFATAQEIIIKKQYPIESNGVNQAFYPNLNTDGSQLLFTSENYVGLQLYEFKSGTTKTISQGVNAGFEPVFSENNSKVFYRISQYEQGRRLDALESFDLKTERKDQMMSPQRNLHKPQTYHNGLIVEADKKMYKTTFGRTKAEIPSYVSSEDLKIFVYANQVKREIKSFDEENIQYIWVSLSPDASKILFTALGKGTFVCDLEGKIISEIGYLNAPIWYNDNFVVGMVDKDDGLRVVSSKITMRSLDGSVVKELSKANEIAMYPTASQQAGKIVYNTDIGELLVTEIEIK